jgi:Kef-type K+ transport system membrane component KefB
VPFTNFALFVGVAMSITAFPVLARILTHERLNRTELGVVALGCAATDDVTAWCLLALVTGVAKTQVGAGLLVMAGALAYLAAMLLVVRARITRFARRSAGQLTSFRAVAVLLVALLTSSLTTEFLGIHAIFGAFMLGAVIPHDSALARDFIRRWEPVVTVVLLPSFFALTGMRTQINLLSGVQPWLICGLIILTATLGKFGGTLIAARLTGLGWRDAATLGALMNTRGLMELIVLNVGLDLGVISPTLFAMMVVMALVTTLATSPVLRLLTARPASV